MITLNVDFFSLDGEQVGTFGNNDTVAHVYFLLRLISHHSRQNH